MLFGIIARRGAGAGFAADPVPQAMVITGIVVALLFYEDARYIKERNAAAQGWSVYEGPEY